MVHKHNYKNIFRFRKFLRFVIFILLIIPVFLVFTLGINHFNNEISSNRTPINWHTGLLRKIDAMDSVLPSSDILAVFSTWKQNSLLIRLDFLESPDKTQSYLIEFADSILKEEKITAAVLKFEFSLVELPKVFLLNNGTTVSIELNETGSDWFSIRLEGLSRTHWPYTQISLFSQNAIIDETGWFDLRQTTPPAGVFIAFYNTLDAKTPAQALRQWDGAHSGPIGTRHGLRHLLANINIYSIPVTLLDINTKDSLQLLARLDNSGLFYHLVQDGLVQVPDNTYGEIRIQSEISLLNRLYSRLAALPSSSAIFGPVSTFLPGYDIYFYASQENVASIYSTLDYRLIPIALEEQKILVNEGGLTQDAIALLANTGSSEDGSEIVILGGDFTKSFWGVPNSSAQVFSYIAEHPWIKPLTPQEMQQLPAQPISSFPQKCSNLLCISDASYVSNNNETNTWPYNGYAQLKQLPQNSITQSARQLFAELTTPSSTIELSQLKQSYHSTVYYLLLASEWSVNPSEMQTCSHSNETKYCALSNEHVLAILSPTDGSLVMLFTSHNGKINQWLAPYSQYVIGLSDPADWQIDMDLFSDPAMVEGAFRDSDNATSYTIDISPQKMTFTSKDSTVKKTYTLTDSTLSVTVLTAQPETFLIPILGNLLQATQISTIQIQADIANKNAGTLKIKSEGIKILQSLSYTDSSELMVLPEDPNKAYPIGHYLPIPFSQIEFDSQEQFSIFFSFLH